MTRSRLPTRLAPLALAAACLVGCGYGPVGPAAYEHAQSLYTVSNLKASAAVDGAAQAIDADLAAGRITPQEAGWLRAICQDCRDGRWPEAQAAARRIMEDQVSR